MPDDDDNDEGTMVASRAELLKAMREQSARTSPYVLVVNGKHTVGRMFKLIGEMIIGRARSADLSLDEEGVSRAHAKLKVRDDGRIELQDLGSTNGTFVNGKPITLHVLEDGDKIQIGTISILKFSYQDAMDEALQKNLYDSATKDGLTRIFNKKTFLDGLDKEFAFASRHKRPLSLILFDVDHFKKVNDTRGHPAGDYVLQTLAQRVGTTLRAEDLFARYGGEEFVILLRDINEEAAVQCAERARALIQATEFVFEGNKIPLTISLGVATLDPARHKAGSELVSAADAYLYQAKHGGRNRVCAAMLGAA